MWFDLKGVPAVVTLGRDALWSELAELAAVRGAQVHLHLVYDRDVSAGASLRRKQLWVNLANFRTFTVAVNAASPERLARPSAPAQGGSIIWEDFRREPHAAARRNGAGPWSAYRLAEAADRDDRNGDRRFDGLREVDVLHGLPRQRSVGEADARASGRVT